MTWKKNSIIQIIISILAIIILSCVAFREAGNIIEDITSETLQHKIDGMRDSINYLFSSFQGDVLEIIVSEDVQAALTADPADSDELCDLESRYQYRYDFYDVHIYSIGECTALSDDDAGILQQLQAKNGQFLITWGQEDNQDQYVQLTKSIYDVNTYSKIIGAITVKIKPTYITSLFPSSLYSEMYGIIDANNALWVSSPSYIPSDMTALLDAKPQQIAQSNYDVYYSKIPGINWKIVAFNSRDLLTEYNNRIIRIICLVCIILIISIIIANFSLSSSLLRSTQILVNNINDYTKNGCTIDALESDILQKETGDIGKLYQSFLMMAETIDNLIDQVYMTEIRKKEAEIAALQAQINPHFLYNTLDSIKWLADKYEAEDIEMMVSNLASMMRFSLNHGSNIITIENELKQVCSYMEIQKIRYDDLFDYEIDVPESLYDRTIIKLLLQPLVENAIVHGYEASSPKGHIVIRAEEKEKTIQFSVTNDGTEIDLEKVEELLGSAPFEQTDGYGIKNVQRRLISQYGRKAGLHYSIRDGKTTVTFDISK